jgi:hypothetical protein
MNGKIATDAQFPASVGRAQRRDFLLRETDRRGWLQVARADGGGG